MSVKQKIIYLLIPVLILLISCRSVQDIKCPETLNQMKSDPYGLQWCGDDTVFVIGEGIPKQHLKEIEKRKESSREAAELQAKYLILEKFKGSCISGGCGGDIYGTGISESYGAEILRIAKSGTVIDCIWDNNQKCTVLYKAVRPGLRQIVMKCSLQ